MMTVVEQPLGISFQTITLLTFITEKQTVSC